MKNPTWLAFAFIVTLTLGCDREASRLRSLPFEELITTGYELLDSGETHKAVQHFEAATAVDPKSGQAFYCLGCALTNMQRHEEAIEAFKTAAKLSPQQATLPLYNMGNSLQALGRNDEAIATFGKVVDMDPSDLDAWTNLGRLLDDAGKHESAIECYDEVLAKTPQDVITLTNRGNSLTSLERYEEALVNFDQALKIAPRDSVATAAKKACLEKAAK